jgi:hypothetical protein
MTIEQWLEHGYLLIIHQWGLVYRAILEKDRVVLYTETGLTPEAALAALRQMLEAHPAEALGEGEA